MQNNLMAFEESERERESGGGGGGGEGGGGGKAIITTYRQLSNYFCEFNYIKN